MDLINAMTNAALAIARLEEDDSLDNLHSLQHAEETLMIEMHMISPNHIMRPLALAICELIENRIH